MFSKFIYAFLFLALNTPVFSQTCSPDNSFLNFSYSFGVTAAFSEEDFSQDNAGTVLTFEVSNIPKENVGFFAGVSVEKFQLGRFSYFEKTADQTLKNYIVSFGMRVYSKNKKLFFDAGTGYYDIGYFEGFNYGISEYTLGKRKGNKSFGFNIGAGARVSVNNSSALVFKGKLHKVFTGRYDYNEFSFNAGFESGNFDRGESKYNPGEVSTGIIAGDFGNPDENFIGSYGCELTYGVSDNLSLVANYIRKPFEKRTGFSYAQNDYAGGIRNYFGENNLKLFLECLADLNITKQNRTYFNFTGNSFEHIEETVIMNSLGIVLGSGTEFDFSDKITGIVKGNVTFYDNTENSTGFFGGVKYRF